VAAGDGGVPQIEGPGAPQRRRVEAEGGTPVLLDYATGISRRFPLSPSAWSWVTSMPAEAR
jgi:hypothetical protein